ncbi:hypothetical protein NP233_g10007 [Leucocoprinus birnbaumii]|uniref:F-box domain-containing protein n=1 Tax=Leucocoprinus birnbaumii TaxID=56174 RepID=A0AAD5VJU7_9AGAR|nr:hypothetical protein NP233_g10007 [Leucocoprinus birnbaumii]
MHQCLAIPDIQHLICELLRTELSLRGRSGPLFTLARTCRAFTEPALDNLYYELESLWPLIKCLPHDAWTVTAPTGLSILDKGTISLRRALSSADAATIQKYSQRVRVIEIDSEGYRVDEGVFHALGFFFPEYLLPNLKRLWFYDSPSRPPIFQYIRLFICPGLTSLRINLQGLDAQTGSLVNSLPSLITPSALRDFHLLFSLRKKAFGHAHLHCISSCIGTWHNLRNLRLTVADYDAILQASRLPHLRRLMVANLDKQQYIDQQEIELISKPFPALRRLTINISLDKGTRLLPLLRGCKLQELKIAQRGPTDNSSLSDFLAGVGKYLKPDSFQTLWINAPINPPEGVSFGAMVAPFLQYSKLQSFKFKLAQLPPLTAQETLQIKTSWPNLRTLCIAAHDGLACEGTNLSSLLPLASGLPRLRRLKMDLNAWCPLDRAELFDMYRRSRDFGVCNSPLKYLDVRWSKISHKEFVAAFLSEAFPNLLHIRSLYLGTDDGDERRNHRRWQTVGQVLLPLLRMTKRKEQLRLTHRDDAMDVEGDEEMEEDKDGADRLAPFWSGRMVDDDEDVSSDGNHTDEDGSDFSTDEESDYGE